MKMVKHQESLMDYSNENTPKRDKFGTRTKKQNFCQILVNNILTIMCCCCPNISCISIPVIYCDYSVGTWWKYKYSATWAPELPRMVNLTYCPGCEHSNEAIRVTTCYKKATVCINPTVGNKYEGEPVLEKINCDKETGDIKDLSYRPALQCEWGWGTKTTHNWANIYVTEVVITDCSDVGCFIKGKICKEGGDCDGLWVTRPNKGASVEYQEICEITREGVYCPSQKRVLSSSDKIVKSNVTLDNIKRGKNENIQHWVETLQNTTDNEIKESKLMILNLIEGLGSSNNITDNIPGLDIQDNKLVVSDCHWSIKEVEIVKGFWKYGSLFVNPFSRELYTDYRESWKDEPLTYDDKKITQDGTVSKTTTTKIYSSILRGSSGLAESLDSYENIIRYTTASSLSDKSWTLNKEKETVVKNIENLKFNYDFLHWVWAGCIGILISLNVITLILKHK